MISGDQGAVDARANACVLAFSRIGAAVRLTSFDSAGGREVGELLAVDLEELRALGKTLADTASTMNAISVTATVTMPGSPIAPASEQSTKTTADAYTRIASNVNEFSAACEWNASSYEDAEEAFRSQLMRYDAGVPR